MDDAHLVAEAAGGSLDLAAARLGEEHFYASLTLCIIDGSSAFRPDVEISAVGGGQYGFMTTGNHYIAILDTEGDLDF